MDLSPERNHFPLLRLPTEVLRIIMEKASERGPNEAALPYYEDLLSLALVCSRLSAAATEVLYSCICIYADEYHDDGLNARLSTSPRLVRLHRTLRENGGPVESFSVPVGFSEPHQPSTPWPRTVASIILDCTNWLYNTRVLIISGYDEHGTFIPELGEITYRVLSCARMSMPRLECIDILNDISYHRDVLTLYDIQLALSGGCSDLKHLMIRQRVRHSSHPHRGNAIGRLRNSNLRSGFSLSSLTLVNSSDHPDSVRNFVTWLKGLKHFTLRWDFGSRFGGRRDPQWTIALVGEILKPHRDSIESIKLGMMSQPGLGDFDASNFPNLETLTMHHSDVRGVVISTCPQLQAARLHDVVITTDNIEEEIFYNA
ncbi:hypothetical protein FMEXI_2237 [Fusarium mexicanum]|uniref:F-box domain-containing protein n=1 Tax=Fusarium mexicanum TaxID=751941 RepID=A0A8H5JGI6_9HYPO|nr:hypothetical protein FMEXI_2237 [Fusarium mexicanum]